MLGLDPKPLRVCLSERRNPHRMWLRLYEMYFVSNVARKAQFQPSLTDCATQINLCRTLLILSKKVSTYGRVREALSRLHANYYPSSCFRGKTQSPYGRIVAAMKNSGQYLTWDNFTARLLQEYE